jgi:TRAP-type transport system small permease protein
MKSNLLTRGVEWLLIVLLGIMVVLVFGNVMLRYVFNSGIVFSEEVSRFVFMWVTLIGALVVMKDNAHLGMSSVVDRFGETGKRLCRFASDALTLGCCALLAHGTWKQVVIGMDNRAPVTDVPLGLVYLCLLISSVGMALVVAHSMWRQLAGRMTLEELAPGETAIVE